MAATIKSPFNLTSYNIKNNDIIPLKYISYFFNSKNACSFQLYFFIT